MLFESAKIGNSFLSATFLPLFLFNLSGNQVVKMKKTMLNDIEKDFSRTFALSNFSLCSKILGTSRLSHTSITAKQQ